MRALARMLMFICLAFPFAMATATSAGAETRTLKLYYIHTGERAEITFKKDGKYIKSGLDKLNRFLRDWRRNEPTRMDPQLFDIVWEAYRMSGATGYIHVVSGYRSPATNEMLRRTRGGQAKKSQHMLGKAMDFFIPGVKLTKLREVGFKLQGGGVGYYPKSGSPFVHFDTGNVRAWPRMSRQELVRIFPSGKTLHLPPDGKPLPGYQQALASYQARKKAGQATAIVTRGSGGSSSGSGGGLLAGLFGGSDEEEDNVEAAAPVARPSTTVTQRRVPETPQTPGTLLAALAPGDMPLPQFAPRANPIVPLDAPARPIIPLDAPRPAVAIPAETPAPPGVRRLQAEPPVQLASINPGILSSRRSAAEIEAALNASITGQPESGSDRKTIEALIAAAPAPKAAAENPVYAAFGVPVPIPLPRPGSRAEQEFAVASVPMPADDSGSITDAGTRPIAFAPPVRPAIPEDADGLTRRIGKAPIPESRILAAYDTGVSTTEKSPRSAILTGSSESGIPPAEVIPVDQIDPARFGSWQTASVSVTDYGRAAERPVFMQNALREAPTSVYTDGFRKNAAPDPRRFSGKAVNFLTVARFVSGTGGDGMPLTLQLPMTN